MTKESQRKKTVDAAIHRGEAIVSRGTTKPDGALPELGLKDVVPNGSWLEQKQMQSALESRKHFIEVERIEKSGSLSHAEWHEDLMLAEVTHKVGGHWQFMGHNVGKQLYLYPEEALFLIELNALQLTYNQVTVSLQQAYSLLLRSKISLVQYQVYSSLSRVGYKVFRHDPPARKPETKKEDREKDGTGVEDCSMVTRDNSDKESKSVIPSVSEEKSTNENCRKVAMMDTDIKSCDTDLKAESCDNNEVEVSASIDTNGFTSDRVKPMEVHFVDSTCGNHSEQVNQFIDDPTNNSVAFTLKKLESRQLKPSDPLEAEKHFKIVPEMFQNQIVTVNIPREEFIPKNVFLNSITYVLNVEGIRSKRRTETHGLNETGNEVNGSHIRRVKETPEPPTLQNNWTQNIFNVRPFGPQFRPIFPQIRSFGLQFFPPPPNVTNVTHWNLFMNLAQRLTLYQRPPPLLRFPNFANTHVGSVTSTTNGTPNQTNQSTRKRKRDHSKKIHMDAIKKLAERLKSIIQSGNNEKENIIALQRLINTYNIRYRTKLRLSPEFDICNNETIVDTIELDDEEEIASKKPKETNDVTYDDNLNRIKQLVADLKQLEAKNKATARHRRVSSALVKKFNKAYNADITLKNNEVVDKSLISLDSSSESDCVVQDTKTVVASGKKLKNPFSILKRLSEKRKASTNIPSSACDSNDNKNSNNLTLSEAIAERYTQINDNINLETNRIESSDEFKKQFADWLPPENDFGRPELPQRNSVHNIIMDHKRDEYIYEFIKNHSNDFANWLDLKIGYLKAIEAAQNRFSSNLIKPSPLEMDESNLKPIIGPEDGSEIPALLDKLSIFKTCTKISDESTLEIDFDVYNRDVQNFRKTNRPTPHFRVICLSESSAFPAGRDVAALHSLYTDGVTILFAAVGVGSVSYVQANPHSLPVYVPIQE